MRKLDQIISAKAAFQLTLVLIAAGSLKLYYSAASVNGLQWILWPTARLTQLVTGTTFEFESFAGYMSEDRSFLIAAPCSGVNFMIAAFVMLALIKLWRDRSHGVSWSYFLTVTLAAYAVTIIANTVRITTTLWLHNRPATSTWFSPDELHRIAGISVFFGFLLLLFMLSIWQNAYPSHHSFRPLLFPLLVYYATTLGVPFAGGAFLQPVFWEHSVFVIVTPIVLITPLMLLMSIRNAIFPAPILWRHTIDDRKDFFVAVRDRARCRAWRRLV